MSLLSEVRKIIPASPGFSYVYIAGDELIECPIIAWAIEWDIDVVVETNAFYAYPITANGAEELSNPFLIKDSLGRYYDPRTIDFGDDKAAALEYLRRNK